MRTTTAIIDPKFKRPVTGPDLIAFQRLVRRVPVAEPVMRYALRLVRTSRPKSTNAPESVKKYVAFGASVRAAQYLVLGAKARALTERPLPRELRRHPRAGASGAAAPRAHQLPRGVGRHHDGLDHRRAAGGRAGAEVGNVTRRRDVPTPMHALQAMRPTMPGARFVDPKVLARIGNLELLARTVVDGFINGLHRAPYFGASIDFAEHRGYVAGDDIRRVDWRLYARTDRYYVKQYEADTNTNFSVLLDVSKSMSFGSQGVTEARVRELPRRVPRVPGAPAARPRRHHHVRQRHRRLRAAVGEALQRAAAHARPREGRSGPASSARRSRTWPSTSSAAASCVLISDFYEDPDAILEAIKPLQVPRQRPDRVPRARSGGDRLRLQRRVELRGSRERRADAGRARVVRGRVPQADSRSTSTR